jgi:hypothetical protein
MTSVLVRFGSVVWGLAAVVVTSVHLPAPYFGWLLVVGGLAVMVAGWRSWLAFFEPIALVLVVGGAGVSAVYGRLSIPSAVLVALLVFGYVLATDLAGTLAGAAALRGVGLAAWVRAQVPVLVASGCAMAVIVVTLLLPIAARAWLVLLAPVALFGAAFLAVGRRVSRSAP